MHLTPKRLRALRMIQQHPGMVASALVEVCDRQTVSWQEKDFSRFDKATANAAATRWGAGGQGS